MISSLLWNVHKKQGDFGVNFLLCVFVTKICAKNRQKCLFTNPKVCGIIILLSAAPTPAASRTIVFVKAKYQSYDIFHRPANPVVLLFLSETSNFRRAKRILTPFGPIFYINEEKSIKIL